MSAKLKPGYKQTEVGVIPEDWEVANLGTTCTQVTTGKLDVNAMTPNGQYRFYTCARDWYYIDTYAFDTEALLVSGNGANVGYIHYYNGKFNAYQRTYVLSGFLNSIKYLQHYMGQKLSDRIRVEVNAGNTPYITRGTLTKMKVAMPPTKAEQETIAEALSAADALIESLEQLLVKKRQLKQGAMQELLTGKRRLPGFSGEWEVKRFGEIAQPRRERIDPRRTGRHDFCIELEHIDQGTGCLVGHTMTSEGSSLKSVFQKDDVLFGKLRAYLRKYWLANREGVCSTEIWVLTAKRPQLIPQFLFQLVKVDRFIEAASSAYGTHMPRSDWSVVKNYEVGLPPIPEQTAIATILSDMDAEIAALEAKLAKARQIKQGMMQELLTGRIRLV
ncbi:MAG: restriction endonuclease subunit S [Candidatus Eisenbacteria sp.]|nr:restriction endonuclease subunit S [Candidatus Eisenbacteria bacterium]